MQTSPPAPAYTKVSADTKVLADKSAGKPPQGGEIVARQLSSGGEFESTSPLQAKSGIRGVLFRPPSIKRGTGGVLKLAPLFLSFTLMMIFVPLTTFAQDESFFIPDPLNITESSEAGTQTSQQTVETLVVRIATGILAFVGVLSFAVFLYAGVSWMLASGNEPKVDHSKKVMFWAVIGMVITFGSYAILKTVFSTLVESFGI